MIFSSFQKKAESNKVGDQRKLIADLDKLVAEPVTFKLQGEIHELSPLTTQQFIIVVEKLHSFNKLIQESDESQVIELVDKIYEVFKTACPTITKKHIEDMTFSQRVALLQIIINSVTGEAQTEEKKK